MNVRGPDRAGPPGTTAGLVGTTVVHAAAIAFLLVGVTPPPPSAPAYAVDLVAAPAAAPRQRIAREAIPTPPR
ncbi:MAG: hypothetical protein H0W67_10215, partial [Gemmatimonadales bacterium]|nr:hypothetical protein [Gemmatimonadales bacterium]